LTIEAERKKRDTSQLFKLPQSQLFWGTKRAFYFRFSAIASSSSFVCFYCAAVYSENALKKLVDERPEAEPPLGV
jgi:hypothetical protein